MVEQEKALLESKGHEVRLMAADNDTIIGLRSKVKAAIEGTYSRSSRARACGEISSFRPDIVHVHNFFPLLSPSVYYACRAAKVPVVQTLHNFRLICPSGLLFREGKPCELCVGKTVAWPGVVHSCYRNSRLGSAALASMLATHRIWGTWREAIDAYITMTNFAWRRLVAGGLPADRLFVKPNSVVPDPGKGTGARGFALFAGRLSPEKGVATMMSAWDRLGYGRKLKIVGDGPLRAIVQKATLRSPNIEYLEHQPGEVVLDLMGAASFLVFPSECYEGFPRVVVEAFAKGLPVLASRLGSAEELIGHGRTGMLVQPRNAQDLADTAEWLFTHPAERERMSEAARLEFETKYTADRTYRQLIEVYRFAMATCECRKSQEHGEVHG